MSLRDSDSGWSPNYLNAEKVVELLHVRHLELVGKEGFDLIDFDESILNARIHSGDIMVTLDHLSVYSLSR